MRIDASFLELLKSHFVTRHGPSTIEGTLSPSVNEGANLGEAYRRYDRIYARAVIADNFSSGGVSISNADTLDGFHALPTPTTDTLLPLNAFGVFPEEVYPNALLMNGSRALTGDLSVAAGVKIDGVDLSVHAADFASHHLNGMESDDHSQYVHLSIARTIQAVHTIDPPMPSAPFTLGANAQGQTVVGLKADQLNKQVIAGSGLSGGGALTGNITLDVVSGDGIQLISDAVAIKIKAPSGLEVDANGLALSDTIAGDGLSISTKSLQVDTAHDFTWTGVHTFQNNLLARHILPEGSDAYDLGNSVKYWRQGFISQLNAVVFAEMTASLLGGWLIVGKGQGSFAAAVSSNAIEIDFGQAMTPGHFVLVRAHDMVGYAQTEYIQVGALVSGFTYNVTRDLAGAHGTDPSWAAGTPYLILGQSGDGRIELNAYDTPRIQIVEQGATYSVQTERLRIGDLNGWGPIVSQAFGWAVGDYPGNEYAYYTPSSGLVLRGTIRADDGFLGNLSIDGVLSIATNGGLYQGTGSFASPTTGLKLWSDGGVGRIAGYNSGLQQWYASTDGKLYAGSGSVVLDVDGVTITAGQSASNYMKWSVNGNTILRIYGYGALPSYTESRILATGNSTYTDANLWLAAISYGQFGDYIEVGFPTAHFGSGGMQFNIDSNKHPSGYYSWSKYEYSTFTDLMKMLKTGLLYTRSVYAANLFSGGPVNYGDIWADSDMRVKGGLFVGNLTTTPTIGVIAATKYLDLAEQGSTPSTPSAGWGRWYVDAIGAAMYKNDGGVAANLETNEISIDIQGCYYAGASGTGAVTSWYWYLRDIPNNTADPDPQVYFNWVCPPSWAGKTVYMDIWWLPNDASTGNVRWEGIYRQAKPGIDWTGAAWSTQIVSAASGSTSLVVCSTMSFTMPSNVGRDSNIVTYIIRNGNTAEDTYSKKVHLMGIRLRVT